MKPLTGQQFALLNYLRSCETCPSFVEMQDAIGLRSKSGVHRLIDALEERGYIRRIRARARAIELIDRPEWTAAAPKPAADTLTVLDDWCARRAARIGARAAQHILGRGCLDDPNYRALLGEHRAYLAMRSFIHGSRSASGIEASSGGETTQIGSTEGESPTGEAGDAQP